MSGQKSQQFLFIAVAIVVMMAGLTLLVTDVNGFSAQAKSVPHLFSSTNQPNSWVIGQQQWLTNSFSFPGNTPIAGTQVETAGTSASGLIGTLSTVSATFVSPAAFHQGSNSVSASSPASGFRFFPVGGYIYNTSATTMTLLAPVDLPHGATISKLSMVLFDNHTTDVTAVLYRKNLTGTLAGTPPETIIALGTTISDAQKVFLVSNTTLVGSGAVSNEYGYYITFQFMPNTNLDQLVFGFSVEYTPAGGPEPGVEVMPMTAFRHNGDNADDARFDFNTGFLKNESASNQTCFIAPVYPPDGATITKLHTSITDFDAGKNITTTLRRVEQSTGTASSLATIPSSGAATNTELTTTTIISPVVSNTFSYYVTFCLEVNMPTTMVFFGSRVSYTP